MRGGRICLRNHGSELLRTFSLVLPALLLRVSTNYFQLEDRCWEPSRQEAARNSRPHTYLDIVGVGWLDRYLDNLRNLIFLPPSL